jgi:hypothetical protein
LVLWQELDVQLKKRMGALESPRFRTARPPFDGPHVAPDVVPYVERVAVEPFFQLRTISPANNDYATFLARLHNGLGRVDGMIFRSESPLTAIQLSVFA